MPARRRSGVLAGRTLGWRQFISCQAYCWISAGKVCQYCCRAMTYCLVSASIVSTRTACCDGNMPAMPNSRASAANPRSRYRDAAETALQFVPRRRRGPVPESAGDAQSSPRHVARPHTSPASGRLLLPDATNATRAAASGVSPALSRISTDFLRSKPLQRLIAPAVYVCSLIRDSLQDDLSLIGG